MLDLSPLFETVASTGIKRPSAKKISAKNNQALIYKLKLETAWLPEDALIAERIFVYHQELTSRPKCKICAGELHPSAFLRFKYTNGYTTFCSSKCVRQDADLKLKTQRLIQEKYGVDHVFQSKEIKDKIRITNYDRHGVYSTLELDKVKLARTRALSERSDLSYRIAAVKRLSPKFSVDYTWIKDDKLYIDELLVKHLHNSCGQTFTWKLHDGLLPKCPACFKSTNNTTNIHRKITDWLTSKNVEFIENKRSLLPPTKLEIDIFIPSLNIGIEINGLYWHSELKTERQLVQLTSNYHLKKTQLAEANGIKLIHLWEHELNEKFDQVINFLESKINVVIKLNARSLIIKQVGKLEEKEFLTNNHLQGFTNSKTCFGLYKNDELIQVASFGVSRFDKSIEWELIRLASKSGYSVRGGASKLITAFKRMFDPKSLISYAERRLGSPSVYIKLGFSEVRRTSPGYFYWKSNKVGTSIISRYSAQKHKLVKLLGSNFDPLKTEKENMLLAGYGMVKDCGQIVYIWTKSLK